MLQHRTCQVFHLANLPGLFLNLTGFFLNLTGLFLNLSGLFIPALAGGARVNLTGFHRREPARSYFLFLNLSGFFSPALAGGARVNLTGFFHPAYLVTLRQSSFS